MARRAAGAFGYDLVRPVAGRGPLERHLRALFKRLDFNCVIDVGANRGQYAESLRRNGYRGRIVSFEPLDSCFEALEAKCRDDPEWRCLPYGLGREPGVREIHQTSASVLSSFLPPSANAVEQFGEQAAVLGMRSVEVRALDDVFSEIVAGLEAPRIFLKLDTQGFDLEVFAGARASLPQILGLQSEHSVVPLYEGTPDYVEALSQYRDAGFHPTGFFPVIRFGGEFVMAEFDCVMLRRGLVAG